MDNYEEYYNTGGLIVKYLQGGLTNEELEILDNWRKQNEENERLFVRLTTEKYLLELLPRYRVSDKERAFKEVLDSIQKTERQKTSFRYRRYIAYAASVALLIGVAYVAITSGFVGKPASEQLVSQELLPGGNRALLILDGGREIDLDRAGTGEIARQGSAVISKTEEGYVAYELALESGAKDLGESFPGYNTISTPRGGQYRLRLPDGSLVWLNAESSLRFPTYFDPAERKVILTGEAYFEVVPSTNGALPFRVVSGRQTIEVLGTEFNVSGYLDEGSITTTLVTGKVRIGVGPDASPGRQAITLSPGQKARVKDLTERIEVSEADVEESVAWKNGHFQFNDTDLGTIMRQIARWYDVEVEYTGEVQELRFKGKIPRDVPASHVFKILQTSGVNIKTEGKKIVVSI